MTPEERQATDDGERWAMLEEIAILREAITEAHSILMESYTPEGATPLHEELLPLLTIALMRTKARR